ncbi:hypothetical protein HPB50_014363 [Hyalomma asiaticum]|uniref:Uncharacterized protein n=1 Tax=Hyalomma asiaticum TaxID=266040 RepID=A0ACB7T7C3_HYAAI|nr:hypothetical protein HPB50_014363 [Hyalomma asiaticum]
MSVCGCNSDVVAFLFKRSQLDVDVGQVAVDSESAFAQRRSATDDFTAILAERISSIEYESGREAPVSLPFHPVTSQWTVTTMSWLMEAHYRASSKSG